MFAVLISIPLMLLAPVSIPQRPACGVEPIAPSAVEAPVVEAFRGRIDAYMQVHNAVERKLSLQWSFVDAEEIFEAVGAMQSGIREARPDARRGAVFTDDIAWLIRKRLEARLEACNQRVDDVLDFINEERLPGAREPVIHETFPWTIGSAMWPSFLAVLPPLPKELQYRFSDRDLVLIDIHADLVVDILVNALPAPVHAGHGAHRR